ncbi:signal peptidase II [candidate division KSB1 bacterium]|nr:signal peptidase II [candidate division KSB1 bacterium]
MDSSNKLPPKSHNLNILVLIIVLFTLDQLTKYLAAKYVPLNYVAWSIKGFGITYRENRGLVLHLLNQYSWIILASAILKILLVPTVTFMWRFYTRIYRNSRLITMAYVLMMAALFGNSFDQFAFGYVRDFILWPGPGVPNLADLFADASLICMILEFIRNPQVNNKEFFRLKVKRNDFILLKRCVQFSKDEIRSFFRK